TGLVLRSMGNMAPYQTAAMRRLSVDAYDAVAVLLQESDNLPPAGGIVPVLALHGALRRDADVTLGDRPRLVGELDPRRFLGRVDTEDITSRPVQPDVAEVAGLIKAVLVAEEHSHFIGGIVVLRL